MALTDNRLTVREAVEYLRLNGLKMNEPLLRVYLSLGRIPSERIFGRRVVGRVALAKYAQKRGKK